MIEGKGREGLSVPKDLAEEWEAKLAAEHMPAELPPDKAAQALGELIDFEAVRQMHTEMLSYLAQREEIYGSHDHMIRRLAKEFALQGHETLIESYLRSAEEEMTQIQTAIDAAHAGTKNPKRLEQIVCEQFPDVDADVIGILIMRIDERKSGARRLKMSGGRDGD